MKKFLNLKLKKDDGFTGQDILIAVFITMAFLSLIVTLLINISNTSYEIEKTKQMTELISKVADRVDQMSFNDFEDTATEKDISEIPELKSYEIPKGISLKYTVSTEGDDDDPTRTITLIGIYRVSGVENKIKIPVKKKTIKDDSDNGNTGGNDNITPSIGTMYQYPFNIPKNSGNYQGEELVPVKFIWTKLDKNSTRQGYWVITTEDDKEWYSIEEGIYPTYVSASVSRARQTFRMPDSSTKTYEIINQSVKPITSGWYRQNGVDLYVWVPRIAGDRQKYGYAFETSNYEIVERSGGGYELQTPELANYNTSIFPSTARGVLVRYNRSSGFSGNSTYNALPYQTQLSLSKFDRHDDYARNN